MKMLLYFTFSQVGLFWNESHMSINSLNHNLKIINKENTLKMYFIYKKKIIWIIFNHSMSYINTAEQITLWLYKCMSYFHRKHIISDFLGKIPDN